MGTLLLLLHLGSHPPFPYNWEPYTILYFLDFWHSPTLNIFHLTDSVMTDSGKSPIGVLPIWLFFKIYGLGLTQLRLPFALLTSMVIPAFWLIARRLSGTMVASLATSLLIFSPVFLLYGRTATIVGISLLLLVISVYLLIRFIQNPSSWHYLIALQLMFLVNTYGYAPLRLLWPLCIFIFIVEIFFQRGKRYIFLFAAILTILVLPFFLNLFYSTSGFSPISTVSRYYNGAGEQIFIINNQNSYHYFLRNKTVFQNTAPSKSKNFLLPLSLISQNTKDYIRKLFDQNTKPVLTNYWQFDGRLYSHILVPFFLIGIFFAFIKARKQLEYRILLVLFFGFGIPLILTSHVDVGRLIFTLPFLLLITANGFIQFLNFVYYWLIKSKFLPHYFVSNFRTPLILGCSLIVVIIVAISTWQDYHVSPVLSKGQSFCTILNNTPIYTTLRSYYFGC